MQMKSILVRFRFSSSSGYRKRQTRLTIEHIVTNPSSCQSKLSPRTTIFNCFSTNSPSYSSPLHFPLTPSPRHSPSPLRYIFFPFAFSHLISHPPSYPLTFLPNFLSSLPLTLLPSFPFLFIFNSPPFLPFPLYLNLSPFLSFPLYL